MTSGSKGTCGKHVPDLHLEDEIKSDPFDCHVCEEDDHFDESTVKARRKLLLVSLFCVFFIVAEVVGGYIAGSLAIMTDAAHLLSDLAGFLISVFALWLTSKKATLNLSFGFHRAEILGALASVFLIWILTLALLYEAVQRILHPTDVNGRLMFIIAVVGLIINGIMAFILHGSGHGHSHGDGGHAHDNHDQEYVGLEDPLLGDHSLPKERHENNINVRAAYIHIIGDIVQSVGVIIAATVIWVHPEYRIVDPICTILFSIIVLFTTFKLVKESSHILMEGTPNGINPASVQRALKDISLVLGVHDLHIWSIKTGRPALSVHLHICADADDAEALRAAQQCLVNKFNICHSTIQIERKCDHAHPAVL